jgi:hypothetical protein
MTMRLLLSLLLVALIATSTVQAKKRLRGERNEPEEVQRVLKQLTGVGQNAFSTSQREGGIKGALDTVRSNLARKGSGRSKGEKGVTTHTPARPGTTATTTFLATSVTASTPAGKGMGGGGGSKGRKEGSDNLARASPTVAPAPSLQYPAPTTTKGSKSDSGNLEKSSRQGESSDMNEISFFHLAPNNAIPIAASDITFEEVGTVFIYGGPLYDVNATIIPNTNFTGVCTKTQKADVIDEDRNLVGGGYCQFTYILDIAADGTPLTTMNAAGEVFDLAGGIMGITGGTGNLGGEAKVIPLYEDGATLFDFFTRAIVYEVNAIIAFSS